MHHLNRIQITSRIIHYMQTLFNQLKRLDFNWNVSIITNIFLKGKIKDTGSKLFLKIIKNHDWGYNKNESI